MRRWTSAAPASRSMRMTDRCVVPRTMESSTTTSRLPAMVVGEGVQLAPDRVGPLPAGPGAMKERPM